MTDPIHIHQDAAATRNVTLLMLLCGLVASGVAGAADGPTPDRDGPSLTVQFFRPTLATDDGARAVYRRIVRAAETVCPLQSGSPFVTKAVKACRKEAVARAVRDIGSIRLAALHATSAKRG